jgi:hypothetical protein
MAIQETVRNQKLQEFHNEMITENVVSLAQVAKESLAPLSIEVSGAKWTYLANPHDERECISIMFPVVVSDKFFGDIYDHAYALSQRRGLIGALYNEQVMTVLSNRFPNMNIFLDAFPLPSTDNSHVHIFPPIEHAVVEDIVPVQTLVENNEITVGSDLYKYSKEYMLDDALTDSGHIVSPDPSTAESFLLLGISDPSIRSVLEIGAGVSPTALLADRIGITDYTIADNSQKVCSYLSLRHPSYRVVQVDAKNEEDMKPVLDRLYDVVILGMPYEYNPVAIERFGDWFSKNARYMIIQSGSPGFYQWEHDLLMGKRETKMWPWWNLAMSVQCHFPYFIESVISYQHTIITSRDDGRINTPQFSEYLKESGFFSHNWIDTIHV